MELTQNRRRAVTSYTLADAQVLNTIKNQLRDVTRILDASGKANPQSLEAHQVKHEVVVLPTLPIDQTGCALAEEAIGFVEWDYIAQRLGEKILLTNLAALKWPTPSTTA